MGTRPVSGPSQVTPTVALMLQGGGALGAYHIGAYQALAEHDLHPDWVAGISIGAINAAIIAGNRPDDRVERLAAWWEAISWPDLPAPLALTPWQTLHNMASNAEAVLFGQPNFFTPRPVNPYLCPPAPPQDVSFYDTSPLLPTLRRFADFALINRRAVRLSLGATDLATGDLEFFDNHRQTIGPEHVLASGSLPPGFPATLVDGKPYWDGGCVSNSPLDAVIDEPGHPRMVVFLLDLWDAAGPPPETMNDVLWRAKQIQYASRTAHQVDGVATKVNLRHAVRLLKAAGVSEVAAVPDDPVLAARRLDIVHIVYRPDAGEIPNSDAEFSRSSIAGRRAAGYRDMQTALAAEPWLRQEMPAHLGASRRAGAPGGAGDGGDAAGAQPADDDQQAAVHLSRCAGEACPRALDPGVGAKRRVRDVTHDPHLAISARRADPLRGSTPRGGRGGGLRCDPRGQRARHRAVCAHFVERV